VTEARRKDFNQCNAIKQQKGKRKEKFLLSQHNSPAGKQRKKKQLLPATSNSLGHKSDRPTVSRKEYTNNTTYQRKQSKTSGVGKIIFLPVTPH